MLLREKTDGGTANNQTVCAFSGINQRVCLNGRRLPFPVEVYRTELSFLSPFEQATAVGVYVCRYEGGGGGVGVGESNFT